MKALSSIWRSNSASIGSLFQILATSERRLPCSGSSLGLFTTPIRMASGTVDLLPFVVPVFAGGEHVFADAGAYSGILQALDHFGVTAIVGPGGNEGRKAVEPCGIGVGVGGDVDSGGARGVDLGDDLAACGPNSVCRRLSGARSPLARGPHLPMRTASSMAARTASPSLRMWVA